MRGRAPGRRWPPARPRSLIAGRLGQDLALACRDDGKAGLEIARAALRDAEPEALARFVSAACLCAAGTDRPPGRKKAERLAER